ncbi:unnamed protein product [Urochloa humidicola]
MATSAGTPSGAYGYSSRSSLSRSGSYSYTAITNHKLTRQRSMPAAVAAAFTSCGRPVSLGDADADVVEHPGRAPAARPASGGSVAAVVRAVLAWIGRGRRRKAAVVMGLRRSGSSAATGKEQWYGDEESYAQNFDEGDAAGEPENLSRSFSVRYARQRTPWRDGAR